ncbi:MAG TPA: TetR family transcriptional regulator, partial [Vicinamibacterales bacterium]|nr:TetR family transcriptional regulator [Vicinamibacterales bacterium]
MALQAVSRRSKTEPPPGPKRDAILRAATDVFAESGYFNAQVADVARAAGVAAGTVYLYFRSKDDLLAAVFQRHNPLPAFEAIVEELFDLPARDGLLFFAQRLALLLPEKRQVIRLLVREM